MNGWNTYTVYIHRIYMNVYIYMSFICVCVWEYDCMVEVGTSVCAFYIRFLKTIQQPHVTVNWAKEE